MVRNPSVDKNGIKKGAWSEEEDTILRAYVEKYGHWNWRQLPKYAGLARCGKSCRLRWLNYLKPGLKKGVYSKQEEELILKLRDQLGNKWSIIALELPGRTDNEIKNYWHTHLRKKTQEDPKSSKLQTKEKTNTTNKVQEQNKNFSLTKSKSSNQRSQNRECDSSYNDNSILEPSGSFWSEPFLLDTSSNTMVSLSPSGSCNSTLLNTLASSKSFLESSGRFLEEPISLDDYKSILEETNPNGNDDFQMDPFLLEASENRFFPTNYDDELYHVFSSSSSMDEGLDIPFSSSPYDGYDLLDDFWHSNAKM